MLSDSCPRRRRLVGAATTALVLGLVPVVAGCGGPEVYSSSDLPRGTDEPGSALAFFDDADLDAGDGSVGNTYHYVHERRWDASGWRELMAALDGATTDPAIVGDPDGSRSSQAALVASRILTYLPARDDADELPELFQEDAAAGAAESLAHIVATYAVALGPSTHVPAGAAPSLWQPTVDALGGEVQQAPLVTEDAFAGSVALAVSTDDGLVELRTGLNHFRAETAASMADLVAAGTVPTDRGLAVALSVVDRDIFTERMVLRALRADTTRTPAERDRRVRQWVAAGTEVFGMIDRIGVDEADFRPDGVTLTGIVSRGIGTDQQSVRAAFDAAAEPPEGASTTTEVASLQEWYLLAVLLERADLWRQATSLDVVRPGGQLLTWEDLEAAPQDRRDAFVDQLTDPRAARGFGSVERHRPGPR